MGVPKLARMSFSATLTMVMSIIAIRAAVITTAVMPSLEPETCGVSMCVPFRALSAGRLLGDDRDLRAQAGAQGQLGDAVDAHQHRHALHDLREVAGGVVGRQKREARAGAAGQAVDVSLVLLTVQH